MNRERVIEILETYRPGEGLESDPEVRMALEMAAADPELARLQDQIRIFDDLVKVRMRQIEVPSGLSAQILAAARTRGLSGNFPRPSRPAAGILSWFHPVAFAVAASVVILLAVSFTYWNKPRDPGPESTAIALADSSLMQTAHALYTSLRPKFRSSEGSEILNYLNTQGGSVPSHLPGNVAWDKSFACDVVDFKGTKVSVICFTAPDNSRSMHLFTFHRSDFPDCQVPDKPRICHQNGCCCATWFDEDGEQIHVLFSDKGTENLIAVLDI